MMSPFAVPETLSVMVTDGAVVSTTSVCVAAELTLPAASLAVTETLFEPPTDSVPLAGVAAPVSTLHVPFVAVTV